MSESNGKGTSRKTPYQSYCNIITTSFCRLLILVFLVFRKLFIRMFFKEILYSQGLQLMIYQKGFAWCLSHFQSKQNRHKIFNICQMFQNCIWMGNQKATCIVWLHFSNCNLAISMNVNEISLFLMQKRKSFKVF